MFTAEEILSFSLETRALTAILPSRVRIFLLYSPGPRDLAVTNLREDAAEIKCRFFQGTELGGTWLAMGQATKFPICNSALFPDRLARPRTRARANVMEML